MTYIIFFAVSILASVVAVSYTHLEAKERVERDGFRILKVKAGINPADDIRALTLIREAVGNDIRLRVDANQGYTANDAVATLKEFEKVGVEAVEQCLPWWDMDGAKFVRSKVDLKIMLRCV